MKTVVELIFIAVFLFSMGAIACAIYFCYRAITNLRPDSQAYANLLAPFVIFIPGFFTEAGQRYRRRFFVALLMGVAPMVPVLVIKVLQTT